MLKYFIRKTCGSGRFFKPKIMVCVPSGVTEVEKRAVREAATQAGGKDASKIADALEKAKADKDIGVVLMTEKLINMCKQTVYDMKLNSTKPLIVEIPDRHGTSDISKSIDGYVRDAIGLKL